MVKKKVMPKLEENLINNLIELQKIHVSLINKFDRLSGQLSELLMLFELSAKSFAQQHSPQIAEKDKAFLDKIDRLLEQNKVIAKGLTLMEEKMRERLYSQQPQMQVPPQIPQNYGMEPRPLPRV